jgi:hypothetical protein
MFKADCPSFFFFFIFLKTGGKEYAETEKEEERKR